MMTNTSHIYGINKCKWPKSYLNKEQRTSGCITRQRLILCCIEESHLEWQFRKIEHGAPG